MKKDRFKLIAVVNFIIEKDGKVFLMKRSDGFFKGGYWVLPAGHVDGNETIRAAGIRELREELDIDAKIQDLEFVHVLHCLTPFLERVDFFFKVKQFTGTIQNMEADKCDEIGFFPYDALPVQQLGGPTKQLFDMMQRGEYFSEKGFDEGKRGFSDIDKFSFTTFYNLIEKKSEQKKITPGDIQKICAKFEGGRNLPPPDLIGEAIEKLSVLAHQSGYDIHEILFRQMNKK
ncbi:MAG: NUDIX domain-containing protein [Lactobacillales bacterium]|jgi:ADP-ribose pyrophosphatase YjhB (NUDIX family)|nr:NUDIX domain-containing protein [Lactobacillales bacterium]